MVNSHYDPHLTYKDLQLHPSNLRFSDQSGRIKQRGLLYCLWNFRSGTTGFWWSNWAGRRQCFFFGKYIPGNSKWPFIHFYSFFIAGRFDWMIPLKGHLRTNRQVDMHFFSEAFDRFSSASRGLCKPTQRRLHGFFLRLWLFFWNEISCFGMVSGRWHRLSPLWEIQGGEDSQRGALRLNDIILMDVKGSTQVISNSLNIESCRPYLLVLQKEMSFMTGQKASSNDCRPSHDALLIAMGFDVAPLWTYKNR